MQNLIPHFIYKQYAQKQYHGQFEATTLYVDISGFTQLTEALMQQHKAGAEVLSNALNRVFAPLLAEVYRCGGFIINFAGDAFSAVFPQAENTTQNAVAQRAFWVATFIQEFFQHYGNLKTQYGNFNIGVKVGLGNGKITWYILGDATAHTYYFCGPALTSCFEAERQAQSGDIRVCPALEAVLKPGATSGCVRPPLAPSTQIMSFPDEAMPPFIQKAIIERATCDVPAEFRQVVSIFLNFELPSNDIDTLEVFTRNVLHLVTEYEGYFNKLDYSDKGNLMVILFGAPIAHENDLVRAADFLLTLQQLTAPWSNIHWKAGIAYGMVYTGIIGGQERREYGALGDVMNLACRMMQHADWKQLWLDENAAKQLGDSYHVHALRAYTFKGKQEPHLVHSLSSKKTLTETFYPGRMIGRKHELGQLQAAIQPILEGYFAGLICVYGEAGIGKTRLVHSLRQHLIPQHGIRWFTCPADALLHQSLNPFKYMLRIYFKQAENVSAYKNQMSFNTVFDTLWQNVNHKAQTNATLHTLLAELERTRSILGALVDLHWTGSLYAQLDPQLRFQNTLMACKTFLQAEATLQPVILHIEDGQWLDADSQHMLDELMRTMAECPVAFLFTSRQAPVEADGNPVAAGTPHHTLHLHAVNAPDICTITEQCLQGPISKDLADLLIRKTDGNPFFVEQLALNLREHGLVKQTQMGTWHLTQSTPPTLPDTLNGVLVARLDRLSSPVRQVVQTGAILGREVEIPVLTRMLPHVENLARKLQQAEVAAIWSPFGKTRLLFRHALLRDAAYAMQMPAHLREQHRAAAAAIAIVYQDNLSVHYADLAYHYDQAELPIQAAHWHQQAGKQAAEQFANSAAITTLSRALALALTSNHAQRYAILLARERVYDLQGRRQAQQQDLAALRDLVDEDPAMDAGRQAEIALREASYAELRGDFHRATASAQRAVQIAHAHKDTRTEGTAYLRWGRALWRLANYEAAQSHLTVALQLIQQAQATAIEADCLRNLGNVSWSLGDYKTAMHYYRRALPQYHKVGNRKGEGSTLNNIAIVMMDLGDYAAAQTYSRQALTLSKQIGHRISSGIARNTLGDIAFHLGEYEEAESYYQQFVRATHVTKDLPGNCEGLLGLARIAHQRGQADTARRYSLEARRIAQSINDANLEAHAWLCLGHAWASSEQLADAKTAYTSAITLRRQMQQWHLITEPLADLAMLELTQGHVESARKHINEILAYIEDISLDNIREPFNVYVACVHILRLTDPELAADLRREAYHVLQTRAAKISDMTLQRAYLENIPSHREIVRLWEAVE